MTDIKLTVRTDSQAIREIFDELPPEQKNEVLDLFTSTEIIEALEKHLKGKGDFWAFDTTGWRYGSEIREAISKMQGLEEEMRRDHSHKVQSLERDVENYRAYYDWYFRGYHDDFEKHRALEARIGRPK